MPKSSIWWSMPFFINDVYDKVLGKVNEDIASGKFIEPPFEHILMSYLLTPEHKTKVVILGQDPYPTPLMATGLAFGVPDNLPTPVSLQNIFKELKSDLNVEPVSKTLYDWAHQGVLLLNTSLTVEVGKPGSHADYGWNSLITDTIDRLNTHVFVVYILWGKHAQSYEKLISPLHAVIKSSHPSSRSARKGFFGSGPFSKTNRLLEAHNMDPIIWGKECSS